MPAAGAEREVMQRRDVLKGLLAVPMAVAAVASTPVDVSAASAWRIHLVTVDGRERIVDAATGEQIGNRVPMKVMHRVYRSQSSGRPVKIRLFKLDAAGKKFWSGNRVATEWAWVQVVGGPA